MNEARDEVYCHLTARRSVATAALRLGLERMSEEALDALAGVLVSYLDRLGQTLALGVEASGRSSAHCNILDCLRAVEQCTSQAVQRVHMDALLNSQGTTLLHDTTDPSHNNSNSNNNRNNASSMGGNSNAFRMDPTEVMSWKGLAAFCFGPEWHKPIVDQTEKEETKDGSSSDDKEQEIPGGGKVGPSLTTVEGGPSPIMTAMETMLGGQGWHAPFPDEIPAFPVVWQNDTANPVHSSLLRTADSLHCHETYPPGDTPTPSSTEENDMPDMIFQQWGELGSTSSTAKPDTTVATAAGAKRKREGDSMEQGGKSGENKKPKGEGTTPSKKSKADDSGEATADGEQEEEDYDDEDERHPNYVPRHFPSFPRPTDLVGPMVADDEDDEGEARFRPTDPSQDGGEDDTKKPAALGSSGISNTIKEGAEFEPTLKVRAALVRLGRPWGDVVESSSGLPTAKRFQVPAGPSVTGKNPADPNDSTSQQQAVLKPQIVPLGRASGSRVSRILEGSMDSFNS